MKRVRPDDLLNDFRVGDANAFTEIVKTYNRSIRYFAWQIVKSPEVAEEIANDSFLKVWETRERFESMAAIKSFLYVVTRNACLNHVQSFEQRGLVGILDVEQHLSDEHNIEARLIETELLEAIYREIEQLPKKQRVVFQLAFLKGLSVSEISEKLNITPNAVYLNKSLATKSLRRVFKNRNLALALFFLSVIMEN